MALLMLPSRRLSFGAAPPVVRMRDLILAQTVEERRKRQNGDYEAGSSEKRRRRDDHAA